MRTFDVELLRRQVLHSVQVGHGDSGPPLLRWDAVKPNRWRVVAVGPLQHDFIKSSLSCWSRARTSRTRTQLKRICKGRTPLFRAFLISIFPERLSRSNSIFAPAAECLWNASGTHIRSNLALLARCQRCHGLGAAASARGKPDCAREWPTPARPRPGADGASAVRLARVSDAVPLDAARQVT